MNEKSDAAETPPDPGKYEFIDKIVSTTVNQVWRGKKISNQKEITIKQTKLYVKDGYFPPTVFRELVILSEINYPHIIRPYFKEISVDLTTQVITYCLENHLTSIQKIIRFYKKKNEILSNVAIKSILFQTLLAIDHLHSRNIAHCNLVPSSLVLAPQTERIPGILKILDLGFSRIMKESSSKSLNMVHPWYRAPEIMLGDSSYDKSIDIWAAGCVFAELLTGSIIFGSTKKENNGEPNPIPTSEYNSSQLMIIASILGPITANDCAHPQNCRFLQQFLRIQPANLQNTLATLVNTTPDAFDLLSRMLTYNHLRRITAHDALQHQYFCNEPYCATNIVSLFPKKDIDSLMKQQHLQQTHTPNRIPSTE